MVILTAKLGENSDLFPDILELYAKLGDIIADVTYGRGIFWKNIPTNKYWLLSSDITTGTNLSDLPYLNNSIDVFVIDPPYAHSSKKTPIKDSIAKVYNLNSMSGRKGVRALYIGGTKEAYRILKDKGIYIVKCQDEIESGKQHWNHIELINEIESKGFLCIDLFVLVSKNKPTMRHNYQLHARKNHSYFLIFQKKVKQ